ncbi:methylated-DNA--[protein]-cysteine S-methyltransferase [Aquimarina sp. ERC-38]|uniref:methylated-DNA--[protein]-cysteine S-methyltransferase n=1 Tax=Aquimarina sp. ERC-38 TaxID=2949996 RepID=UPI0022466FA0|nr:methylated-DNA--[protein]-cysteine S-methyltransferase [Aquimarina sp. ERC-38]UZO82003.1 methylated-DNA--[protein]-cysteine S-methyltransferase [Aquimarina sp. ERC-38]
METESFIETPLGIAQIRGSKEGISSISILNEKEPANLSDKVPDELKTAVKQLQEYFKGKRTEFDFNVNPSGTDFQKKVWKELLQIPFGKTCSYMDIAKKLGDPKCIRAAASANGKNPLWIVVPCHRVIGSNGELTGYAGGLWRKKWLLDHENPVKQQSLF